MITISRGGARLPGAAARAEDQIAAHDAALDEAEQVVYARPSAWSALRRELGRLVIGTFTSPDRSAARIC